MKNRLNEIIEKKGLTATKFAAMINVNPSAVSHLLKGRNKPGYDVLVNIARAFPDISMDWLLTGKGEMLADKTTSPDFIPYKQTEIPEQDSEPAYRKTESPENNTAAFSEETATVRSSVNENKILKRIILFFSDGSFEDYQKN